MKTQGRHRHATQRDTRPAHHPETPWRPSFAPGEEELTARGITSRNVLGPAMAARIGGPEGLRRLEAASLADAAAGRVTPLVTRFPLAEAAAAHRALETRRTVGKVVLIP
ncbi:hypothetical protein SABIM44S_02295 [Streptomyces abikoensis]